MHQSVCQWQSIKYRQQAQDLQQGISLFEGSDVVEQEIVGNSVDGHCQGQLSANDNGEHADPDGDNGEGDEERGADPPHDVGPAALAIHEPPKDVEL